MAGLNLKGPLTVGIDITNRCNLRCKHCYANSGIDSRIPDITFEKFLDVLEELNELGTSVIALAGGEPLLRVDLCEIVKAITEKNILLFLNSNGQLLTLDYAKKLKKSGLNHIEISIDGLEKNHDIVRGKGTFKKAMEGFKNAQKAGLGVGIMTVVCRQNVEDAEKLIDFFYKKKAIGIGFIRFKPVGRGELVKDWELSPLERKKFVETIYEKKVFYNQKGFNVKVETPISILAAQHYPDFLKKNLYLNGAIRGCPGGIISMHINADGTVTSCSQMPLTVGSIYMSSIKDLWNNSELFLKLRSRIYKGKCAGCRNLDICGGCRTAAYLATGDVMGEDPGCWA